jgi:NAD-dependent DNA ligase
MSQIFISYSSKDRAKAQKLVRVLENKGWSVWWDKKIPAGKAFDLAISKALNEAQCVVVLWSKNSVKSDWVWEEADEAKQRKILVPIVIDSVKIPFGFRRIQTVDLSRWRGTDSSGNFAKLSNAIESLTHVAPKSRKKSEKKIAKIASKRRITGGLDGKTIVFTGALSEFRKVHAKKVATVGARYVNSVSKLTDYLVVGEKPGAVKLSDAKKYGVKKITERQWLNLLNDAYKRILNGKTVVFTGKLSQDRKSQEKLAKKYGAKVANAISSKTNFLIVGKNPGAAKIKAAENYDIEIINEDLWTEILQSLK